MSTINSKKPLTKQETIADNIKLLIEQLEAGNSEPLPILMAMSRFHNYSFRAMGERFNFAKRKSSSN